MRWTYAPTEYYSNGNRDTNTRVCALFSPSRNQTLPCHGSLTRRSLVSIRWRPRPQLRHKPPGWEIRDKILM